MCPSTDASFPVLVVLLIIRIFGVRLKDGTLFRSARSVLWTWLEVSEQTPLGQRALVSRSDFLLASVVFSVPRPRVDFIFTSRKEQTSTNL